MRVGLDGIPLTLVRTGVGHYTFELARALAQISPSDQFDLISPGPPSALSSDELSSLPPNLDFIQARQRKRWWAFGLPLYLRKAKLALFHGTNYELPLWANCGKVVTIHDLSPLLHPEMHRPEAAKRARRRLPLTIKSADAVITDSNSVKREICEHFGTNKEKVFVTPLAARHVFKRVPPVEAEQVRDRFGIQKEFILFVGTIEPRKNLIGLVKAFAELLRATDLRPQLVLAGSEGWLNDELFDRIRHSGVAGKIYLPGYVNDEDLAALYSTCSVCVYPSLYEGFGLPPLEAMACGAPVITTNISAITETVGDAAVLVSPTDVEGLTKSFANVLTDANQRARLSARGLKRAAGFSWEKTARSTLEVYQEVLKRPKHASR